MLSEGEWENISSEAKGICGVMCIHEWKEGLTVVFFVRVLHSFVHFVSMRPRDADQSRLVPPVPMQCASNSSFSFSLELVCNMMKPISSQRLVSSSLGEIWGGGSTGF
jgi:hypothetical protein